jgi:hypothetical protein
MLLLIIDNLSFLRQKDIYSYLFDLKSVIITPSLDEAKTIITNGFKVGENQHNVLLISKVLIDKNINNDNELTQISDIFSGVIILKVKDEQTGIDLIKKKLITDFYVADNDPAVEVKRLIKVFETVTLNESLKQQMKNFDFTIKELNEIEKKCRVKARQ